MKFKIGDRITFDAMGGKAIYLITDIGENAYMLKCEYNPKTPATFHDWYSIETADINAKKFSKLEKALK